MKLKKEKEVSVAKRERERDVQRIATSTNVLKSDYRAEKHVKIKKEKKQLKSGHFSCCYCVKYCTEIAP